MNLMHMLLASDSVTQILVIAIGGGIAIAAIIAGVVKHVYSARVQERSRREIAAYIAEGSMSPEEGERLLNAGQKKWEQS